MNDAHIEKILSDFPKSDYDLVVSMMESVQLRHVMNGPVNLNNTYSAILQLSKGDLNELGNLVEAAKTDFRDVVYWATIENDK